MGDECEYSLDDRFAGLEQDRVESISDEQLKESLEKHGCVVPVVVWREKAVLVDGYRRVRLCGEIGISPPVAYRSFASDADAAAWVLGQQRSRRNLTREQLAVRREYEAKRIAEITGVTLSEGEATNEDRQVRAQSTSTLAASTGVSRRTAQRDLRRAEVISAMPEPLREAAEKLPAKEIASLVKLMPTTPIDVLAVASEKAVEFGIPVKVAIQKYAARPEDSLASEFDAVLQSLDRATRLFKALSGNPELSSIVTQAVISRFSRNIKDSRSIAQQCTPVKHSRCLGIGCDQCNNKGWVPKGND